MSRNAIAALFATGIVLAHGAPAYAFWTRSHWEACNEAGSEAQRARLNCWEFMSAPGPSFSTPYPYERPGSSQVPRYGAPVVRRLG